MSVCVCVCVCVCKCTFFFLHTFFCAYKRFPNLRNLMVRAYPYSIKPLTSQCLYEKM